ncbi:ATP-binding cassette domain-containing protein [Myroides sp. WP-1]|uniref:AAA family ATPase n=1 Tax=Myroides sp. WP-1 TaxID=2759944 RepID=UPI0015FE07BC|nr:ATP-binding cassette domain-containing protein [Myroides sp. WP-1]MBB1139535.1 ATP-binding cassette domain-containing protein [Myroides sp. WP-1]
MIPLETLGKRICIIGNSGAGKSTLAQHLAQQLDLAICHLDQLAHIPYTNWQPRDRELLRSDHQTFLTQHDQWVIEGNYSFLMPERFAQATAIIWLDFSRWNSLYRYTKRALQNDPDRAGNLEGATQQFNWNMIRHILFKFPKSKAKYQKLVETSGLPYVRITSFQALMKAYQTWGL